MSRFTDYLASVNGKAINVDGNYGAQCWDLWSHYAMNMFGASMWATSTNSGGKYHHPGYTCEIWHNFDGSPIRNLFTRHTGTPQRGDVVIWEWGSAVGPQSHIAIVVEDRGANVYTMTQNPGASHYANLSKGGVLGYLRPKDQSIFGGAAPAPTPSGNIAELAAAVIRGDYGNGDQRRAALGSMYDAVQAEVNRILSGGGSAPAPAPSGRQHVVVPGDTLWDISAAYLGDGSRYMEIFNISNFSSGNPNLIYPGEIANIP